MKKGRILTAVGLVILVVGIYFTAGAVLPADESFDLTIPAGDYYYYISYGGLIGGSLEVDYIVADGAVTIYVFDSEQFTEYESTGDTDGNLYTTSGDSGSFTFVMPDSGTYYIVIDHGFLSGILSQDVMWSTTINGVAIVGTVIGLVLVVAGIAIAIIGLRMKDREVAATPAPPQTGVTFFQGQQQKPPGQV
jgi:hypothetical protein